jgi:methylated-DNA-[protein]-cysteine S-methyltransferase
MSRTRAIIATPLGSVLAVRDGEVLDVLCFTGALARAARELQRGRGVVLADVPDAPMPDLAWALDAWLLAGDEAPLRRYTLPPPGSDFAAAVRQALMAVPRGTTVTYGELAARAGAPGKARAAASAVAANLLHLVVPCHRVVAADGPGGYNAGVDLKLALLALEAPSR